MQRRTLLQALLPGIVALHGAPARAQVRAKVAAAPFPTRPITFVTPFAAGSPPDAVVRAVAQAVARQAGQPVIVDNRPGASSIIAAQGIARAAPDGHALLITGNVVFTANPHTFRSLPYAAADFAPVAALASGPMMLYANPRTVPAESAAELVALARQQPDHIRFGYTSTTSRLPAELLQQLCGIRLTGIPYKAGYQALPDLLEGRIDLLFTDLGALAHHRAGRLRALAVADHERSPLAPDIPTLAEDGIVGVELPYWFAAYAPAHTPVPAIAHLHELLAAACHTAEIRNAMALGGTVPFVLAPAALHSFQVEETARWGRAIRATGMQVP
jgi:tripartite-type tricarboxylate transporter receptor subunit TctC